MTCGHTAQARRHPKPRIGSSSLSRATTIRVQIARSTRPEHPTSPSACAHRRRSRSRRHRWSPGFDSRRDHQSEHFTNPAEGEPEDAVDRLLALERTSTTNLWRMALRWGTGRVLRPFADDRLGADEAGDFVRPASSSLSSLGRRSNDDELETGSNPPRSRPQHFREPGHLSTDTQGADHFNERRAPAQ